MATAAPLAGVRVLCVNNYLAGNYGPALLAMHGADVVKVETGKGEAMRSSRPFLPVGADESWSHFELRMLRGMSSIALDLETERDLFERLVGAADVFWTNLRPASATRRGVDWERLRNVNPKLVYASLTGFGLPENGDGEFGGLPAFDILVQGLAGLLGRNAESDGTPVYNGLPVADQVSSLYGAFGVLLGLHKRDATGEGCCVDISMFDSMVALNEKAITMYGLNGQVPPPRASATTAPFGMYQTQDGWVVIAVGSDAVWRRFCEAVGPQIGRPGLADDESLWSGTDRVARSGELDQLVDSFTASRTTREVVDRLLAFDVPAGHSLEVDGIINSQQVRQRGTVRNLATPAGHEYPAVMSPIQVSGSDQVLAPPPRLGASRDRVLRDWLQGVNVNVDVDEIW
ncbi:MAG: CaiB/BaiF CoA-transferase family protein [Candidatus Dormibacteria bacterium]